MMLYRQFRFMHRSKFINLLSLELLLILQLSLSLSRTNSYWKQVLIAWKSTWTNKRWPLQDTLTRGRCWRLWEEQEGEQSYGHSHMTVNTIPTQLATWTSLRTQPLITTTGMALTKVYMDTSQTKLTQLSLIKLSIFSVMIMFMPIAPLCDYTSFLSEIMYTLLYIFILLVHRF